MPKFSANLSFLYPDLPFRDRFAAAAQDGFAAVECALPYDVPADELAGLLNDNSLTFALFNLPSGDWAGGERGIGCLPDRIDEFRAGVAEAVRYTEATGCRTVNCLSGISPADVPFERLQETFVANLAYAADVLGHTGVQLVTELINIRDIPRFFLSTMAHAERTLASTSGVKLQYDFYHVQIMHGDLVPTFRRLADRIGHVQIADNPGRNEPGTGEINYPFVFAELDRAGYAGWVGCEYRPSTGRGAALDWDAQGRRRR